MIGDVVSSPLTHGCQRPCQRIEYTMHEGSVGESNYDHNQNLSLSVYFSSPLVKHMEEYRLMDLANVVSAIGGALGLFLGFSCYGIGRSLIKKAAAASLSCQCRK